MKKVPKHKRLNPARIPAPSGEASRIAAETLIRQHLSVSGGLAGIQKSYIQGGPEVAIFTVSGELIALFDMLMQDLSSGEIKFKAESTVIEVKAATDSELTELRKIAGLPER